MPQPPNIQKMLQQAQKLQEEMEAAQERLKSERVETTAGGGMVKVVVTGEGRIESLEIERDAVDPDDVEMLQDMVLAAVNEALRQAEELREKAMSGAAGFDPMAALGDLGGLGGLLGGGGAPGGGGGMGGAPPNRAARRKQR
jgi:DNA-binding YbaB/EbfC family protein